MTPDQAIWLLARIKELGELAKKGHYYCEDSYYSCPLSTVDDNEIEPDAVCDCGMEQHNKKVSELMSKILNFEC